MSPEQPVDIGHTFRERKPIEEALAEAAQEAVRAHRQAGQPLVVWRQSQIVWLDPETLEPVENPETVATTDG